MSSAGQSADAPEYYDGRSTWSPWPQEMAAVGVPKPIHELENGVVPELGDATAHELQDSNLSIRNTGDGDGAV